MTALPTLKLRVLPTFPSSVTGDGAITVTKTNGVYTIGISQDFSPTWTGSHTFAPTVGDAITITPAPASTARSITSTQSTPTSGSVVGPFSLNLFNITDSFAVTGTGTDSTGLSNGGAVGFRVNTFFSGANVHAAGTLISGLNTATVTSTAAIGDVTGFAGTAYTNVAASISGFLEGINGFAQVGPSGSGVNVLTGVDAVALIQTGGSANYRFGLNCASYGAVQGTTNDAAIALLGSTGNIAWKNGILLSNASGAVPISTTGSLIKSDTASTIANILDLGNITVSGNIAAFPFVGISGAGKMILGAPIASLAAAYNFEVTAASSGNVGILVSTNTTTGYSALSALNSTSATEIDVIANEANRTAVHFGQTVGNWGEVVVTSTNGMLLGTAGAVPLVVGTNNTERMRLLLGLMVGTTTDPGAGIINVLTGFRIGNAAASGNVLRGDGTNFISAQLAAADLSNGTTGSGAVVLATSPTIATPIITTSARIPLVIGGTAASSTLTLESTSGAGTTDSIAFKTGSQVNAGFINTSQQWQIGNASAAPAANAVLTVTKNAASPAPAGTATIMTHTVAVDSGQPVNLIDSYAGANAGNQGFFVIRKARGTAASFTAILSGDALGYFGMVGAKAANSFADETSAGGTTGGVFFGAQATENWSGTNQGAELKLYATPTGSLAIVQGMGVNAGVIIGAPTGSYKGTGTLNIATALYMNGTQVVSTRIAGYTAMTGSPDKATAYATGTVTLAQLAGRVAQLQADLTTHGLIGA